MTRPGALRAVPHETRTLGRLITCAGCGETVDVVEVMLTPSATGIALDPERCGECQRAPEPVVELDGRPDPGREMAGRAHAGAGPTELAAARTSPRKGSQRAEVLEHLRQQGAEGATDFELNELIAPGRRAVSAGTRRAELIRDGWPIVDSGRRRPTDTGAPAVVWALES